MKKLCMLLAALALLVCVTLLPTEVDATTVASGTLGDNLTWALDSEGTMTISGKGSMPIYIGNHHFP